METVPHEKQDITDGVGPLYHRVYSIALGTDEATALRAFENLKADLNAFSPQIYARFEKVTGAPEVLCAGDEYQIHLTGPWNGPVRVQSVEHDHFRLETLQTHLEAGFVDFRLVKNDSGEYVFKIESFAKSRDVIVDLLYDKVPVAKMVQTSMWKKFCESFAALAAELAGQSEAPAKKVQVVTERRDEKSGQWQVI